MRILVVDDHAIVRAGLRRLLATLPAAELAEAATGRDALIQLRARSPELAVLDLNLPGLGGFELIRRMLQESPGLRILVLSMHAEPSYATRAMEAGACGYLSKNAAPEELLLAVERIGQGGRYLEAEIAQEIALQSVAAGPGLGQLSARELEILRLLATGRSLGEMAAALGVSYKTVANTCTQLKAKLGAERTADLVRLAFEMGVAGGR